MGGGWGVAYDRYPGSAIWVEDSADRTRACAPGKAPPACTTRSPCKLLLQLGDRRVHLRHPLNLLVRYVLCVFPPSLLLNLLLQIAHNLLARLIEPLFVRLVDAARADA